MKRKADLAQCQVFELHVLRELPLRDMARKLAVTAAQVYFGKYNVSALVERCWLVTIQNR